MEASTPTPQETPKDDVSVEQAAQAAQGIIDNVPGVAEQATPEPTEASQPLIDSVPGAPEAAAEAPPEAPQLIDSVPGALPETTPDAPASQSVEVINGVPGADGTVPTVEVPAEPQREGFLGASNAHLSPVRLAQQQAAQEQFSAMSAAMSGEAAVSPAAETQAEQVSGEPQPPQTTEAQQ